jgi:transposase
VPPPQIRALRDLTRTRLQLVRDRTREWQRLEKLLEGALVKLSSAVHSLAKTNTARVILEALAGGERDPQALAALADYRVKGGRTAVAQALEGMTLGGHHPMLIRVHLDHIAFLDRSAAAVEDEIEAALDAIPAAQGVSADGTRCADPGPDAPVLPAAARLAEIPGVSLDLARAIIAETGLDMTRFPTAAHLVSWAGLSPVTRQSGPRSRKPQKGQGNDYLKGYSTQAATGAAGTPTFLGERIRRLSRRMGGNKAKCAVARSILVIVWHLLASPHARFTDLGPGWHDRKPAATARSAPTSANCKPSASTSSSPPPPETQTPEPGPFPPAPRAVKPRPLPVTESHGHNAWIFRRRQQMMAQPMVMNASWMSSRTSQRMRSRRNQCNSAMACSTTYRYSPSPEPCRTPRRAMTGRIPLACTSARYLSWS